MEPKKKPGRPPKPKEEKLINATIRMTPQEQERLDRYARRKGWTRSRAVRAFIDLITTED